MTLINNLKAQLNHPHCALAFQHGLSMWVGALAGLMIWVAAQPLPVIKPYELDVVKPVVAAPKTTTAKAPATPPLATSSPATPIPAVPAPSPAPSGPVAQAPSQSPVATTAPVSPTTTKIDEEPASSTTPAPIVPRAPIPGLTEEVPPYGRIPIIDPKDQTRPFDAYRRPFDEKLLNRPLIALVLLDYGLSKITSQRMLDTAPADVSLALAPAASDANTWASMAHNKGHELWLNMVVEPIDYPQSDPGASALLTASSVEQNESALLTQLARVDGWYTGLLAPNPSPYFKSGADADFVAARVFARGLGLVANEPQANPILLREAQKQKAAFYAGRMFTLDRSGDPTLMLRGAERLASEQGFAIVLVPSTPAVRKAALEWAGTLSGRGMALAPLSVIAARGPQLMGAR